jgi:anti-sigma regulatory factor (Ser/Thr protein kinase)
MAASFAWFSGPPSDGELDSRDAGAVMTMRLDHDVELVGVARRALGRWLYERGCRAVDDAVLVLSELVTNAMVHAGAGCTIEMQHNDDRLRLEVRDRSPRAPLMRVVRPSDLGGRGLHFVDGITEAWGWEPTVDGKRVWAIVRAAVQRASDDAPH